MGRSSVKCNNYDCSSTRIQRIRSVITIVFALKTDPGLERTPKSGSILGAIQHKSTLGRRLESESTSFRAITDQVKNLLAKEYLTNTELSVADIAHLLDYTDTANFRRAFVRWNGKTPNAYRHSAMLA